MDEQTKAEVAERLRRYFDLPAGYTDDEVIEVGRDRLFTSALHISLAWEQFVGTLRPALEEAQATILAFYGRLEAAGVIKELQEEE